MSTLCARGADRAEGSAGVTSEVTEALLRNAVDERGEERQDAVDEAPRILIVSGYGGKSNRSGIASVAIEALAAETARRDREHRAGSNVRVSSATDFVRCSRDILSVPLVHVCFVSRREPILRIGRGAKSTFG